MPKRPRGRDAPDDCVQNGHTIDAVSSTAHLRVSLRTVAFIQCLEKVEASGGVAGVNGIQGRSKVRNVEAFSTARFWIEFRREVLGCTTAWMASSHVS